MTDVNPPKKRQPTISEVAAEAQVARSTVSRAFAKPERLKKETVTHVLAVAKRLGFHPNPLARALSTGRTRIIGLIVPDIANPFFPPLIRAAQRKAEESDFDVFLGDSDEDAEREEKLVRRFGQQVAGLVLVSSRLSAGQIRELTRLYPVVLVNQDLPDTLRVLIDSGPGIVSAVEHLVGLGHRKLVYVGGPSKSWAQRRRSTTIRQAAIQMGAELTTVSTPKPTHEGGRSVANAVLASGATAAVAFDDLLAQGMMAGLAERGVRVPQDFSIIGCDDVIGATTTPPLTTVSGNVQEAAEIAVSLLVSALGGSQATEARHVMGTHLVIRASTAPPPKA